MEKLHVISENRTIMGTKYVETYEFKSGHKVPIYEIFDSHGLNQIIGYIKLINRTYGNVYYRGQCKLHETMRPSLYHKSHSPNYVGKSNERLNNIVKKTINDKRFMKVVNRSCGDKDSLVIIESILQHYGINTRCIDAVDNHWIALWFGLHKYCSEKIGKYTYASYSDRCQNQYQLVSSKEILAGDFSAVYQYMILIAADKGIESQGVTKGNDIITVDLRVALPSTFLRPHAQHGVVLRKNLHEPSSDFDISKNVVGILKIRNDLAKKWLGDGELAKFSNLFPSQFHDQAYRILLERDDLFSDGVNSIVRYIYE